MIGDRFSYNFKQPIFFMKYHSSNYTNFIIPSNGERCYKEDRIEFNELI